MPAPTNRPRCPHGTASTSTTTSTRLCRLPPTGRRRTRRGATTAPIVAGAGAGAAATATATAAVPPLVLRSGSSFSSSNDNNNNAAAPQLLTLSPPLLLAPMAGFSSSPLRRLCLEQGAALATTEMLVAACLARRERDTLRLASWHPSEAPETRSAQIYGVRPPDVEAAAALLSGRGDGGGDGVSPSSLRVAHVDCNFSCPVKKITSRGGGSALPARPRLYASLVRAAVRGAAGRAAVTVKLRVGLSAAAEGFGGRAADTCLEAGLIAAAEGAAAVTLHCRRAEQGYAPPVDLGAAARLVEVLGRGSGGGSGRDQIPVVVNGDVCTGAQALAALRQTGAAGVMVGRGAMGRPWAFRGIARALLGDGVGGPQEEEEEEPTLGEALDVALRHAELWSEHERWLDEQEEEEGEHEAAVGADEAGSPSGRRRRRRRRQQGEGEARAMYKMRRLWPLYTLGHEDDVRDALLQRLMRCGTVLEAREHVAAAATAAAAAEGAFARRPAAWAATAPRLKTGAYGAVQRVALPADWLAPERVMDEEPPDWLLDEAAEG